MPGAALISVRLPESTRDALERAARAEGQTRTDLVQRYVEEGLVMDRYPGLVFRSGPAGRRPGLSGGPDVWEIARVLRNAPERGEAAVTAAVEWFGLSRAAIEVVVAYYADHQAEIDAWLDRIDAEAERARAAAELRADVLR